MKARMDEIISEYAQLPEMEHVDLILQEEGSQGDVLVLLSGMTQGGSKRTAERVIGFKEDLGWIADTFDYPNTFTPRSKDIALKGLKRAYFNSHGYLVLERDDTREEFKVKDTQKEEVISILRHKLGKLFKG